MNTLRGSLFSFFLVSAAAACSGGGMTTTDGGADSGPPCATGGMGSLAVTITGLPASGPATPVTLTGGDGTARMVGPGTVMLPSGNYTITAVNVTTPDPIVRTVYAPTISAGQVCVGSAAQTATVTYAVVPTSNKIWFATSNAPNMANLQGFTSAQLMAAGTPDGTIASKAGSGRQLLFDKNGNLWANGGTTADPNILRIPASAFAASGTAMADRKINIKGANCLPTVGGLAMDKEGSLWVSSNCGKVIYKLTQAQLAMSADDVVPSVTLTLTEGPQGIAFDKDGNLFAGTEDHLVKFNAASLASSSAMPSLILGATTKAVGGAPLHPGWLAFDKDCALWTNDFGGNVIFQFTPAELATTSAHDVVPPALVVIQVGALLGGMAFDEGGGLWITYSATKFARLTRPQLDITTDPGNPTIPDRVFTSTNLGYGENMALYPAPANLPLPSALP